MFVKHSDINVLTYLESLVPMICCTTNMESMDFWSTFIMLLVAACDSIRVLASLAYKTEQTYQDDIPQNKTQYSLICPIKMQTY